MSIDGTELSIEDGNTVDLASLLGSTDVPLPAGMAWISSASFNLGSPQAEGGRDSDEDDTAGSGGRQVTVSILNGFWIGIHEVTQREYVNLIGINPSFFNGDLDQPVEQVSWNDAVAYCLALTAQERAVENIPTGWEYRLPTEAEWEYASRAGTVTAYSFDNSTSDLEDYAWFSENSIQTSAVGLKLPNPWGLYDVHGNVAEWVSDFYADSYFPGALIDPDGPASGSFRVIRGGSWSQQSSEVRSAARRNAAASSLSMDVGFRVVLAPVR